MIVQYTGPPQTIRHAETQKIIKIEYKTPYSTHKTLGHCKTPGVTCKFQKSTLTEKGLIWREVTPWSPYVFCYTISGAFC